MRKILALLCALLVLFSFIGCSLAVNDPPQNDENTAFVPDGKTLTVHFLDVGQGDSIFIELPTGKTVLIDASISEASDLIKAYIEGRGHEKIDYLIATHPHADHIGGMRAIVNAFEIGEVWMPNADSTSATYEKLLTAIEDKGLSIHTAKAGKSVLDEENLRLTLLAPCADEYESLNNYSAVVKLTYGKVGFLFTGDAEVLSENEMLASGVDLSADVLKIGHHGSSTSSSETFLKAVSPKWGVISCGKDNSYGHPHKEILASASKLGITLCRTDLEGTIVFTTDGAEITTTTVGEIPDIEDGENDGENEQNARWVLNTSSKKIHTPDCSSVATISEQNKALSSESIESLSEEGYTPCGSCKPTD